MSGHHPDATVRYADHGDGILDLHLPTDPSSATGLLVYLHGGFWRQAWDRRHARPLARAFADRGWVVASPEYRRVGGEGGWPATGDDVLLAVRRLPDLLVGLGLRAADPVVVGHSAGGHLALWLARQDVPLRRVVPLAPVCDLGEAIRLDLGDGATRAMLGAHDPAEADPAVLLREPGVPIEIVHGTDDDVVPLSLSEGLVRRHPWVGLTPTPGDHFSVITPGSCAWPTVLGAVEG